MLDNHGSVLMSPKVDKLSPAGFTFVERPKIVVFFSFTTARQTKILNFIKYVSMYLFI